MGDIQDTLKKLLKQYPTLARRVTEAEAVTRWASCVGEGIAKHTQALRVENGVLYVEVDHAIWKSELHHCKQQILTKLNTTLSNANQNTPVILDLFLIEPQKPNVPKNNWARPRTVAKKRLY